MAIHFNGDPVKGYLTQYRPKGSLGPYNSVTQLTGSPVMLFDHLIALTDYEGIINGTCAASNSISVPFATHQYANSIGNVIVDPCLTLNANGLISSVIFNGIQLDTTDNLLSVAPGKTAPVICRLPGTFTLVINHTLTSGTISVTGSDSIVSTAPLALVSHSFTGITINSSKSFTIQVSC